MARERCVVVVHAAVARVVTMQRGSYKAVPRCHADDYAALTLFRRPGDIWTQSLFKPAKMIRIIDRLRGLVGLL